MVIVISVRMYLHKLTQSRFIYSGSYLMGADMILSRPVGASIQCLISLDSNNLTDLPIY